MISFSGCQPKKSVQPKSLDYDVWNRSF